MTIFITCHYKFLVRISNAMDDDNHHKFFTCIANAMDNGNTYKMPTRRAAGVGGSLSFISTGDLLLACNYLILSVCQTSWSC